MSRVPRVVARRSKRNGQLAGILSASTGKINTEEVPVEIEFGLTMRREREEMTDL